MESISMLNTSKRIKVGQNIQEEEQEFEETIHQTPIPDLPIHMVFDILSWLTIKDLFICRLVCKSWANLLSDPHFAESHLSKSHSNLLIQPIYKKKESRRLQLVDPQHPYSRYYKIKFMPKINLPIGNGAIYHLNSCNGLLCLCECVSCDSIYAFNIYVCNPVQREYIMLSKSPDDVKFDSSCCAIGFCPKTNQYKVVRTLPSFLNGDDYPTEIYTLGEKCWRNIGNAPYYIQNNSFNAFVNGALHWPCFNQSCPEFIRSFDFVTEKFRIIPEPSEFGESQKDYRDPMKICVLKGNLCICDFSDTQLVAIWVMKEYGVKESWRKEYVTENVIYESKYDRYEPIMIMNTGEVLVIFNNDSILEYDPKSEVFKSSLKIFGISSEFYAIAHVPSFISLKDIAKGETLKVLGKK